jgi:hypothetical protein
LTVIDSVTVMAVFATDVAVTLAVMLLAKLAGAS